ncbi:MAG: hypothetical protein WCG83_05305 [Candidatus Peregrinibacteria bacterium]
MDVTVQTGMTKVAKGVSLVALSFVSSLKERVCFLLEVEASPADAKTVEKECVVVIEHALLETEGDPAERLDGALKELNGLLKGLILSKAVSGIHAIVAVVGESGTLHVSHAGAAEAYIIRAGSASQITEYTRGKPLPAFVHIASGQLEARDSVVFSTQRLLRAVTPAQLAHMIQRGEQLFEELEGALEAEGEHAALASLHVRGGRQLSLKEESSPTPAVRGNRRDRRAKASFTLPSLKFSLSPFLHNVQKWAQSVLTSKALSRAWERSAEWVSGIITDLKNPQRRRRAHLLLLAGALGVFLLVWVIVNISAATGQGKTRAELKILLLQIDEEIAIADNRQLTGDVDGVNAALIQAEEEAKQVMNNESGLFRTESLDLLDRIRTKREEINHIVRLSPRLVVNAAAKNPAITLQGLAPLGNSEFTLYDKQNSYRALLNNLEDPVRVTDKETIADATDFPRFQSVVFQTAENSVIEVGKSQTVVMKTEDPAGWISGKDLQTYLRYLYLLSPQNNQIYKYERLSNRYGAPTEYNVNGKLEGALSMAIDSSIFVLKQGGEVVRLFRGESQPFAIRHAPEKNMLETATKVFKVPNGNLYFLDPANSRIIVTTDGGQTGESAYKMQYVLEGDQVGKLKDLSVDPDESRLYVLDDKRLYVVDIVR